MDIFVNFFIYVFLVILIVVEFKSNLDKDDEIFNKNDEIVKLKKEIEKIKISKKEIEANVKNEIKLKMKKKEEKNYEYFGD